MASQFPALPELLLVFFKIIPFVFSILLRVSGPKFDDRWENNLNSYENSLGHDLDRNNHEWKYRRPTIYIYDKTSVESALRLSFFYTAILHIIVLLQSSEVWLAIPTVALIAIGYYLGDIADRFFQMGSDERNPDRYYNYYYDGDNLSTKTRQYFENQLLSDRSQALSPRITSTLVEFSLLVSIVVLELAPKQVAAIVSTIMILVIIVLGGLLFPWRRG